MADISVGLVARPMATGKPDPVISASALAVHLDCSRAYIRKLEVEGVIQRQGDGFPLDQSRVAYLRLLRRERRQSPRSEADSAFVRAKAELITLRIQERKRILIKAEDAARRMETMVGVFLSTLSSLGARVAGRDLVMRRIVDKEVYNSRLEVSAVFSRLADEAGEPRDGND